MADQWLVSVKERLKDAGRDPETSTLWTTVFNKRVTTLCNTSNLDRHDSTIEVWHQMKDGIEKIISDREKPDADKDYNPTSSLISAHSPLLSKVSTPADEVKWVASNINVERPTQDDCPSPIAWAMLHSLHGLENKDMCSTFWNGLYAKLLPNRTQLEQQAKFASDESVQEEDLERILKSGAVGHATVEKELV